MEQEDFKKELYNCEVQHDSVRTMQIDWAHSPTVALLSALMMVLVLIAKILWQILKETKSAAERNNDGVNCLGRIEEAIYDWRQNR